MIGSGKSNGPSVQTNDKNKGLVSQTASASPHRFSYQSKSITTPLQGKEGSTTSNTELLLNQTPSPNKEFRKVSHSYATQREEAPTSNTNLAKPQMDTNQNQMQQQQRPRSMSAGSIRSNHTAHTTLTNMTTNTIQTATDTTSMSDTGAVNRNLSTWFKNSTKDPKFSFMHDSLISVVRSRSSTPTRTSTSTSARMVTPTRSALRPDTSSSTSVVSQQVNASVLHIPAVPHTTPRGWREKHQEAGRDRVDQFISSDNIDYFGLLDSPAPAQEKSSDEAYTDSCYENDAESMNMNLEQRRSMKDAQSGLCTVYSSGVNHDNRASPQHLGMVYSYW